MSKTFRYIKDAFYTSKEVTKQGSDKASKRYSEKYGEEVSPERIKTELNGGGLMTKKTRDYMKMKNEEIKNIKKSNRDRY